MTRSHLMPDLVHEFSMASFSISSLFCVIRRGKNREQAGWERNGGGEGLFGNGLPGTPSKNITFSLWRFAKIYSFIISPTT